MRELDLFLDALKLELDKGVCFIPHLQILPSKFGAIKTIKLDIYSLKDNGTEIISSIEKTENILSENIKNKVIDTMVIETIRNILRLYGI